MLAIPARVIATSFMLTCFAGVVFVGIYNGNGWESVMLSAVGIAMLAYAVGRAVGAVALRGVDEQINRHRMENPIPDEDVGPGKGQPAAG